MAHIRGSRSSRSYLRAHRRPTSWRNPVRLLARGLDGRTRGRGFAVVAVTTWALFRTRWGLRTRAIGEYPKAAGTLGVDVIKLRYRNLLVAGAVAGFGGAWWPVGTVGRFDQNITGGRGFIALAAVIFGRWHPVGALSAALVFGFSEAIQLKLSNLNTGIPSEFLLMSPYLVTLIVVAGFVGRSRSPKASGQPYDAQ